MNSMYSYMAIALFKELEEYYNEWSINIYG